MFLLRRLPGVVIFLLPGTTSALSRRRSVGVSGAEVMGWTRTRRGKMARSISLSTPACPPPPLATEPNATSPARLDPWAFPKPSTADCWPEAGLMVPVVPLIVAGAVARPSELRVSMHRWSVDNPLEK